MSDPYIAFCPAASVSVNATTTSGTTAVALPGYGTVGLDTVRIANLGTVVAYIKFGADATVTADANSIAILPGVIEVMDPSNFYGYFAVYSGTNTQIINITTGTGA